MDDLKIYSVKIVLKSRTYERITLRLPPNCSSCWLYKASAVVSNEPRQPPTASSLGHFDLQNINSLLPSSSQSKLSDGAEKFKSLFDSFQSSGGGSKLGPGSSMMSMNISQHPAAPSDTFMLKSYIDFKFEELEKKVVTLIEDKDRNNQAKLERIITLLESKTDL